MSGKAIQTIGAPSTAHYHTVLLYLVYLNTKEIICEHTVLYDFSFTFGNVLTDALPFRRTGGSVDCITVPSSAASSLYIPSVGTFSSQHESLDCNEPHERRNRLLSHQLRNVPR